MVIQERRRTHEAATTGVEEAARYAQRVAEQAEKMREGARAERERERQVRRECAHECVCPGEGRCTQYSWG